MKIFMPFILLIGLFAYGTASADVMVSAGSNGFAMQISSAPVFNPAPVPVQPHVVHHVHHAPPPPVHHHAHHVPPRPPVHHHGPHHPHAHHHDPHHNHGHRH